MNQPSGEEVRNEQSTETDSQEQRNKVKNGSDIEPQAENWNPRSEENTSSSPTNE
ncbi:hypothetical protein JJQ72_09520 [Paenibacillus sp. F411]|uniref:Uncharacterized protein n=1 Tax=Paenibacillus algicola TaxID=2565926 RepID=A0A4P8XN22_9BACL|nr:MULTISPECIES: hypothetical protein [Paenibacillus]MBO2944205.1 hypothetical protein [Paenibacillus sp. F411]QCT03080.1 hypothetical protein E6C60_2368 [Paenibacillus algicola]